MDREEKDKEKKRKDTNSFIQNTIYVSICHI